MSAAELMGVGTERRRWPFRWGDLTGQPTPPVETFEVSDWTGPHAFAVAGREGWFFVGFWLLYGIAVSNELALGAWANGSSLLGPAALIAFLYASLWWRSGGWVTIDPTDASLSWRRPFANTATVWGFDDLCDVRPRPGFYSATVRIKVQDRSVRVRVPDGKADVLADALRRLPSSEAQ